MATRSNRNTGSMRAYRGSGPVGRWPIKRPGNTNKPRRKTKPLSKGYHSSQEYHRKVIRGQKKVLALLERTHKKIKVNPLTKAVRGALRQNMRK